MDPRLCFKCCRRKLAGKPERPCGDCVLLNVDRLAKVRANHAESFHATRYPPDAFFASSLVDAPSSKPARATASGRRS